MSEYFILGSKPKLFRTNNTEKMLSLSFGSILLTFYLTLIEGSFSKENSGYQGQVTEYLTDRVICGRLHIAGSENRKVNNFQIKKNWHPNNSQMEYLRM